MPETRARRSPASVDGTYRAAGAPGRRRLRDREPGCRGGRRPRPAGRDRRCSGPSSEPTLYGRPDSPRTRIVQSQIGEVGGVEVRAAGRAVAAHLDVIALQRVADEVADREVGVERQERTDEREAARDLDLEIGLRRGDRAEILRRTLALAVARGRVVRSRRAGVLLGEPLAVRRLRCRRPPPSWSAAASATP